MQDKPPSPHQWEMMQRENHLLRELISRMPVHVLALDGEHRIVTGNAPAAACLNLPEESVCEASIEKPFPLNPDQVSLPTQDSPKTRICEVHDEERLVNQTIIPLETLPGGTFYVGEDITSFSEVEKTLKIRENRTKAILDTAAEGIISINAEGIIENFNPAAAHIFGYTTSEVIGRNVKMLMPEPDQSRHDQYINNYLRTHEAKIIGRGREVMGRRKDGNVFPLHLSVSAVQHEGKFLFTGIIRDLTEFKLMQDEVAKAKHLALVGEMAATIAHEIRNPLAGISGALQIIRGNMIQEDPQREIMEEVEQQVDRLSNSVNDLLMFTKPWNPVRDHTVLADLINKVSRTAVMEESFHNMHFDSRVPDDLLAFLDPLLVEQILWNLFQNARDACKGEGTITINAEQNSDQVTLIIADNGTGMSGDTLDRIFKPFFTTKTKGTGLGLPVSKRIMEAHGGDIEAFSEEGEGSRFVLHFQ